MYLRPRFEHEHTLKAIAEDAVSARASESRGKDEELEKRTERNKRRGKFFSIRFFYYSFFFSLREMLYPCSKRKERGRESGHTRHTDLTAISDKTVRNGFL